MEYIEKDVPPNIDPGLVIIALDESDSMRGSRWANVVNGAKALIEFIKNDHKNHEDLKLVIIFFSKEARLIYEDSLSNPPAD